MLFLSYMRSMQDVRANLENLAREHRADFASLSRMLGRNAAYIQQFVRRGVPRKLDEDDRRILAEFFGVSEEVLGGRPAPLPVAPSGKRRKRKDPVAVPFLPTVRASAGPGANAEENEVAVVEFDPTWLREMGVNPDTVSMIRVMGDSMQPTLSDSDDILVDRADANQRLRDGVYVIRIDDVLNVKRLAINPATRKVSVLSDNPAHPSFPDCEPHRIDVIGRVVWMGRRLI